MKNLILAGLSLLSLNAFSQSYLILENGVTLTTDTKAFVYDLNNNILPHKVNVNGGRFLVEEDKLVTINDSGLLTRKNLVVKSVKGKGLNYIITQEGSIITVAADGFAYKFDDSALLKRASKFGGNFFVVTDSVKKTSDLYVVNGKGNYLKNNFPGLNANDISTVGGTFFVAKNIAYTVSQDGFVFEKKDVKVGSIKKTGGNYLITADNKIFTVSAEGFLTQTALPLEFKLQNVSVYGSNYLIDNDGKLFIVDAAGILVYRKVEGHDLRNVKVGSAKPAKPKKP